MRGKIVLRKERVGRERIKTKETFTVKTQYGEVENVPMTTWNELAPYWQPICRAIFEVLIENEFAPYSATIKRPDGFVASNYYWKKSLKDPVAVPLSEAKYFMYKLKEKQFFLDSINEFNQKIRANWLEESNIAVFGGYLCSFCYVLRPALKTVKKGDKNYLKPKLKSKL